MASLFAEPYFTGTPLGSLTFYRSGTLDLATVYADGEAGTELENPVPADSSGRFPAIYLDDAVRYRVIEKLLSLIVVRDIDPVGTAGLSADGLLYTSDATGAVSRSVRSKMVETASPLDFIAPSLHSSILARNYSGDLTAQLQAAIDGSDGYELTFPRGRFPHSSPLLAGKGRTTKIKGVFAPNNTAPAVAAQGSELFYTGVGGSQIVAGTDDGNPDITGFARSFCIEDMVLSTTFGGGAADGVTIQNMASFSVERCKIRGHSRRLLNLAGGNVTGYVGHNDLLGTGVAGCDGIYADDRWFGNFDVTYESNHIRQLDRAFVFTEGRYTRVLNNTCEILSVAQYEFVGSASIGHIVFAFNKSEAQRGYVFKADAFTGVVVKLVDFANENYGAADVSFPNPGYGNFSKASLVEYESAGNLVLDATLNAFVLAPSVFPTTSIFNPLTTVAVTNVPSGRYADDLVAAMRGKNLLGGSGGFGALTGAAVAGTYPNLATGGQPAGWTNQLTSGAWTLASDAIGGGPVCTVAAGVATDVCSIAITLAPLNRARFFVMPITFKGWLIVSTDGVGAFNSGASLAGFASTFARFSVPANATSTTILLAKQSGASLSLADAGVYEIASTDFNSISATGPASLRLLPRGIFG